MSIRMTVLQAGAAILCGVLAACASGGPSRQVHSSVRVEPQPAQPVTSAGDAVVASTALGAPPLLPDLPDTRRAVLSAAPERRLSQLDISPGTPIAAAVLELGAEFGLSVNVDPEVRGTTSARLRNVTLGAALQDLVVRNGYAYQLQGNVLRVVPVRMESRTFTLDYVALSRVGTMSTIVQRRLSSNGGGAQAGTATGLSSLSSGVGALGASGGDVLSAQAVADVWQEIRVNLGGILQAGQPLRAGANPQDQANIASQQTSGGSFGSGASSAAFADGSSLTISPMAGLISVTAMPEKLAEVEHFINEFQASVLRQVLIEAKIVEVTLSKTFEFGIDWSLVNAAGKYGFALRNDPTVQTTGTAGNINFTLTGGATQINAVLTALSTQGNVTVLSNEKTSALNNQRAIFNVTTDEIFFAVTRTPLLGANGGIITTQSSIIPQQVSVGVVLDVLPQVSADNILTMDIRPAVTNIDHIETISLSDGTTASAPVIARREGDTIARLRAGETMIIGGLVQTRKDHAISGIPILKDLPFVGKAFQHLKENDTRTELVMFLTPTIISSQPASGGGGGGPR